MDPAKIEKLEDLNRDHHRRLLLSNDLNHTDTRSKIALIEAMLGCQNRFGMRIFETSKVLELGAGSGQDSETLELELGATYTGIEIVREVAEKIADKNVHHYAIETLPDNWEKSFDFIYSRHVMEHTVDVDTALKRIKAVLAPNGIVGAITPNPKRFDDSMEPAHLARFPMEQWIEEYQLRGLRVVYAIEVDFFVSEVHIVAIHDDWPVEGR